ncbi:hypothetical protein H257_03956 [Aphanomyces astaci]|uniref:PX domain-containing protein n=1 Tax=Aphanomyces astaci TaxID=112090 RepID=W4GVW1_APHAT|nr:hypothetical protein H257_03956 [Aphanomyces astaci]ETV83154.1 hypothetical protein H257_03956 [Aphanomyces astaci]RQM20524.1 hypothetical protein B5M09_009856 [Aphanomyces astaci]|eukprot:XP_009826584.1 hypothetical protein H257_03956 [Aphanomyces astaci]
MGGADNENAVLIAILDAEVVDVRVTTSKDGIPRTEFKLIIWTDRRGQLSVWHKSKTFLNLSTTLTIQQLHQGQPPFDYPSYEAPTMDQINAFLRQAMASSLEWGIRVDADTVVYKINKSTTSDTGYHRSSSSVVNHDSGVVSHEEPSSSSEMSLLKASIVDFRIQTVHAGTNDERECVQYCVVIETSTHGSLQVWRRYSTFRDLANSLELHDALPASPLQPNQLTGGQISQRVAQLNQFLETATTEPSLEWGIRIDKDSCVFKRATKPATDEYQHLSHFQLMQAAPEDHQVSLITVAVKGYRLSGKNAQGQCSIKYNAQLECLSNMHGLCTYSIWRRYGTFHELEKSLQLAGSPRLSDPGEPVHHDKSLIDQRIRKLNRFLDFISHTDDLEWGIRVDAETIVYKRRVV